MTQQEKYRREAEELYPYFDSKDYSGMGAYSVRSYNNAQDRNRLTWIAAREYSADEMEAKDRQIEQQKKDYEFRLHIAYQSGVDAGKEESAKQIEQLREALANLLQGVNGLPPLTAIAGVLTEQCVAAQTALQNTKPINQ